MEINPDNIRLAVEPSEEEKAQGVMTKHIIVGDLPEDRRKMFLEDFAKYLEEREKNLKKREENKSHQPKRNG